MSIPFAISRHLVALATSVTLLQLPVPLLHRHSEFQSQETLSQHILTLHANTAQLPDDAHWHFVRPTDLGDRPQPHEAPKPADSGHLGSGASVAAWCFPMTLERNALFSSGIVASDCHVAGPPLKDVVRGRLHSYFGLPSAVRLCAVLCILRC